MEILALSLSASVFSQCRLLHGLRLMLIFAAGNSGCTKNQPGRHSTVTCPLNDQSTQDIDRLHPRYDREDEGRAGHCAYL